MRCVFVNVLGVKPATFRPFAARPTARSAALWQNVTAGGMAISYTMGHQDRLTQAKPVQVTGSRTLTLPIAGFGTVGIGGVDAVVSDAVARTLGLPAGNAVVISAPKARLDRLLARIRKLAPAGTAVAPLVTQVIMGTQTVTSGAAGAVGAGASQGPALSAVQIARFLAAAESRVGLPYVWGGAGPSTFDCSGLVQWSMAQAGVLVAIYIGNGQMLQAPEPGMNVEIVAADFGAGFAGAIRVYPSIAAAVAGNPAG